MPTRPNRVLLSFGVNDQKTVTHGDSGERAANQCLSKSDEQDANDHERVVKLTTRVSDVLDDQPVDSKPDAPDETETDTTDSREISEGDTDLSRCRDVVSLSGEWCGGCHNRRRWTVSSRDEGRRQLSHESRY